ncbi:unnamed protein product [Rotaria sp. Silwood1]|nr:unnamed protein product [Rotaria sp. Silwood1]
MCEESLIRYRSYRKEQHTDDTIIQYLSPINLLVVTLWYLKHYHSERYISTELNLGRSTVNCFLTEIIDILHSCVYPELISLPVNMASKRKPHGSERHHKLMVHSTFIAIPEPYDSDQRCIGEDYVVTPRKKPHGRELTDEDESFNCDINSTRVAIEYINQRFKTYAILGGVYRGPIDDFEKITKITQVVSALCNMNLDKYPIRK